MHRIAMMLLALVAFAGATEFAQASDSCGGGRYQIGSGCASAQLYHQARIVRSQDCDSSGCRPLNLDCDSSGCRPLGSAKKYSRPGYDCDSSGCRPLTNKYARPGYDCDSSGCRPLNGRNGQASGLYDCDSSGCRRISGGGRSYVYDRAHDDDYDCDSSGCTLKKGHLYYDCDSSGCTLRRRP